MFNFSPQWIDYSVGRSLDRLKTDRLDLLLLHDVEFAGRFERDIMDVALPKLHELKDKGMVRHVGFSC